MCGLQFGTASITTSQEHWQLEILIPARDFGTHFLKHSANMHQPTLYVGG
jgi:hypothetical protein